MRRLLRFKKIVSVLVVLMMIFSFGQYNAIAKGTNEKVNTSLETKNVYNGPEFDASKGIKLNKTKEKSKLDTKLLELTGRKITNTKGSKDSIKAEMKALKQYIPSGSYVKSAGKSAPDDLVYVYIKTKTTQGVNAVEPYTFSIVDKDMKNQLLTAWVNVDKLQQLEALEEVIWVESVIQPKVNVDSEGDKLHRADMVRSLSNGSTGSGMKVGVISNGVDHLSDSVSSGALSSGVTVLSNSVGGDEGTAILEIVHALAPGASLYFHDCGTSTISFNQAVDDLAAAGCNIIMDDIGWTEEPYFEDGVVASHVKDVINSKGIVYVSAAGNWGSSHYIGRYYNDGHNYNDFSSGKSSTYKYMYVNIKPGETVFVSLQWDDPFDNSTNDYDLYLMNTKDSSELESSTVKQWGTGSRPLEGIQYTNNTDTDIDAQIEVENYNGAAAAKMLDLYIYGRNYTNNVVSSSSIYGQAAVPEVITAGAIETASPTAIANYSSQGPVQMLDGTTRQKPDICGAAGVTVSGAGGFPTTFSGTSAAAPHIAAIAALLWSKYPAMKNTEVKDLIVKNAVDLGSTGYDSAFGYGRADAYNSYMAMVKTPIAVIKSDPSSYKGFKVQLDGSSSTVGKGTSLTYNWKIISKPAGSQAQLINPAAAAPFFMADTLGDYKVSLIVNDTISNSEETFANIKVKDITSTTDDMDLSAGTLGTSTGLNAGTVKKPVALTDGWFITGDSNNTIKIMNAFTGFVGKQYQLDAAPNALDFDFDKKLIIASLSNVNKIALIDTNLDSVSYIDAPYSYIGVQFGRNNTAFALKCTWPYSWISTFDISQKIVLNSQQIYGEKYGLMVYNKSTSNLMLGETGVSPSALASYSFDETTNQISQIHYPSGMGSNGLDLAISHDGKSAAFCCGGGNTGIGYKVLDIDCSDISNRFGVWNTGAYPTAAAFSPDDKYVAISNMSQIKIFDSQYHYLIKSINRTGSMADNDKVQFSRGGKIIYDFYSTTVSCYKADIQDLPVSDPSNQPIILTKGDIIAYKGFKIGLDGRGTNDATGILVNYKWSFSSKPTGSQAALVNETTSTPYFIADAVGDYKVSLILDDGLNKTDGGSFNVKIKDMNSTSDDINTSFSNTPVYISGDAGGNAKPIALTDGWVITADDTNKIKIVNAITGAVGKQYQLTSAPSAFDFDFEKKIIIATLSDVNKVVVIDTIHDSISYIDTPYFCKGIVFGENNTAFAAASGFLSVIDVNEKKILNTIQIGAATIGPMAYDKNNNNLFIGEQGNSPSKLFRYSIDEASGQLTLEQSSASLGSNGKDLSISADGKHLAFCCDGGNGTGYNIFDINSSDITQKFGEWNTDTNPAAAGFTLDSRYVVTSNGFSIRIYDVQNHSLINTLSSNNSYKLVFSRGGKFIFSSGSGKITCLASGIQQSLLKGDFDFSGTVDIMDLADISKNYNVKSSDISGWNPEQDLNQDGIIDVYDLVAVSKGM